MEAAGNDLYQNDHMGKIFQEGFSFSGFERDKLYLNVAGKRYVDISGLSGLDSVTDGRGAAYADFDNDGDYDIFLTTLQGQVHHLFKNNVGQDGAFLRVSLAGRESGRDAYGTEVRVKTTQGVLTKIKAGGSGFVSQSDPRLLFGLGADAEAEWIDIKWPSGKRQRLTNIPAQSSILLVEGETHHIALEESRFALPDPLPERDPMLRALRFGPGEFFPNVGLVDASGIKTDFNSLRRGDRTYLVNLWATYCAPCREEMPELQKLAPSLRASGVELLGISLDMDEQRERIPGFLNRMKITYPIFTTERRIFTQLFSGDEIFIPLSYVIDRSGRIADVHSGWSPATEASIRSLIEQ
jgi:thiol-disulfide isomerase/thioredoxin